MPSGLVVKKGSKMVSCSAGGTPGPLSATRSHTRGSRPAAPRLHAGGHAHDALRQLRRGGERLLCIDQQVEHHLADLIGVGTDLGQFGRQCKLQLDAVLRKV